MTSARSSASSRAPGPGRDRPRGAEGSSGRRATILERLAAHGIKRLGSPKRGFRYRTAEGGKVSSADLERIEALRIPPAWKDVAISAAARSPAQAVGRDAAGRWQYLYHSAHVARREQRKLLRLVRFIEALPQMRRAVKRDLRRPGLPREKVLAAVLTILGTCFLRSGSEEYASRYGTYGIATLRRRHVSVQGDLVRFDFVGKLGKRLQRELRDRRLARLIRELVKHPGEVFKFRSEDGAMVDVRTRHINAYIKETMGESFSAKDFRTWAANLLYMCALSGAAREGAASDRDRKQHVRTAVREVSEHLGNTPAVSRASYIIDSLLEDYEKGKLTPRWSDHPDAPLDGSVRALERTEKRLATMLRKAAGSSRKS